ncbi:MAG: sprT domain-containing protein [Bacteroidetes bacterium]|nr:sprT domain-containing protein [Bacteroidota bacterium]
MDIRQVQFERNSVILKKYIPEVSVPIIAAWIIDYDFKLKIKKERSTKLGDYMPPHNGLNHTITINYNLNKYGFLITLIHEVAHLKTYLEYKNNVAAHGPEWKHSFKILMHPFLTTDYFPVDILWALRLHMQNPSASSCNDLKLQRAIKNYDLNNETIFVEHLPLGSKFIYNDTKVFIKKEKIRKRIKCTEVNTLKDYLFHPLTEVKAEENFLAINELNRQHNI